MAASNTNATKATLPARAGIDLTEQHETIEIAEALEAGDTFTMFKLPVGAKVVDVILATDDLDSHGTPLIELDVGITGDLDKFIAASTIGKTGGVGRLNNIDGFQYEFTAEAAVIVSVKTAPATGATTGTISLAVLYTMNN